MAMYLNPQVGDVVNVSSPRMTILNATVVSVNTTGLTLEINGSYITVGNDVTVSLYSRKLVGYAIMYKGRCSMMLYESSEQAHEMAKAAGYDDSYKVLRMEGECEA